MPKVFKVWSHNRTQRKSILLREDVDLLQNLIDQASVKFQITGQKLVLEKDGMEVEEDDILEFFNDTGEVFLLLQHNQHWERRIDPSTSCIESQGSDTEEKQSTSTAKGTKEEVMIKTNEKDKEIHPSIIQPERNNNDIVEQHERHDGHREMVGKSTVDERHDEVDVQGPQIVEQQKLVAEQEGEPVAQNVEDVWKNFKFNWNSCSTRRINDLKQGIKTDETIRYFVHQSVDKMRDVNTSIPEYAMQIVANQIVEAYPSIFQDKNLRNEKLGQGYHTMTSKMINRNNNLNRAKEGKTLAQELGIKCKNLSLLKMSQSGCKNWQPEIKLPYEILEEKRLFLADWVRNHDLDENIENVDPNTAEEPTTRSINEKKKQEAEKMFIFSFAYQRMFLNNLDYPPTFEDILDMWPLLFNLDFYFWHYELLMGHPIHKLEDELKKSQFTIFAFGHQKHLTNDTEISDEEILRIIAKRFAEDHDELFVKFNVKFSIFLF